MNGVHSIGMLELVLAGAVMLLLPHFSPVRFFFAITVHPGFRTSDAGRASLRRYHWVVAAAIGLGGLALWSLGDGAPDLAFGLSMASPLAIGFAAFLWERSRVRRYAEPVSAIREAALSAEDDHLPGWTLLMLPPFAVPLAVAAWLRAHWTDLPARFPVHWDAAGEPNTWAERTPHAVYGPLLMGAGTMLVMLLLSLAVFYGARRRPQRVAMLKIMVAVEYMMALIFTGVSLMPLGRISPVWFFALDGLFVLGIVVWSYRYVTNPALPAEPTPDRRWYLGQIYYNPEDPAVFVQKRVGFCYTFNFGNRLSWMIVGGLSVAFGGLIFVIAR